jgi:Arc/MetJ family transcription regulator
MSTRLQVVMSEAELDEIRAAAERRRTNVSEWVRLVLREERERALRGGTAVVAEGRPPYAAGTGPERRAAMQLEVRQDLVDAVRDRYRLPSRRAAVEYALRRVVVEPMSKEEALDMQGFGWDGDLDTMRSGDPGAPW